MQFAQLLCSRLCHDLVSPSGAVNAGLELLAETNDGDDALALAQRSAGELNDRLGFFRMAFGLGAGLEEPVSLNQARKVADRALASDRVAVRWEGVDLTDRTATGAGMKLLLMTLMVACDSLPRGGAVTVTCALVDGGLGVAVAATGAGARLREGVAEALDRGGDSLDGVTARTVHAAFAARLAARHGVPFEVDTGEPDTVRLALLFSDPGA